MPANQQLYFSKEVPEGVRLKYVIIMARFESRWIFVRHKNRSTWELPAGHIELCESSEIAARRELYEETGALVFDLIQLAYYSVLPHKNNEGGCLFLADITKLGKIPKGFEIAERMISHSLPAALTYPDFQAEFYKYTQYWLNIQSNSDDLWDVYDENRILTGRTIRRGQPLKIGEYHIVVGVWIKDTNTGKYLITQRSPNKGYALMWEHTGGSALAGDSSLEAAIREVKEETGLDLLPRNGNRLLSMKARTDFYDVWLFKQAISLDDIVLQEGETIAARLATKEEILQMIYEGSFVPVHYLDDFIALF